MRGTNIFVFFFLLQWCPEARRFLPDYWNKSDDLWDSFWLFRNLHDRLELTSIQAIEVS